MVHLHAKSEMNDEKDFIILLPQGPQRDNA